VRLPNGEVLMHANAPYDPKKAHDYYLRTRKLKGRKPGTAQPPKMGGLGARSSLAKAARSQPKKHTQISDLSPQQKRELQVVARARVESAQKKLSELNKKLKDKLAEAKKAERDAKKPKTASEKSKDAREAKKYRQSHKQEISTKSKASRGAAKASGKDTSSNNSVEGLKKQIASAEKELATAKAKQKALA
jgi:chromosome segregation ATPase